MMRQPDPQRQLSLRGRLKGLMAFRVIVVTLFLGGTIAVDVDTLASLSNPRNVVLLALIVVTYLLTIIYGLSLRYLNRLRGLAASQLVADLGAAAALVLLTGGLDSLFIVLFYITIVATAIVLGRRSALWTAGATSTFLVALGFLTLADVQIPLVVLSSGVPPTPPLFFEVGVNCAAAFLIAFLAGHLRRRLGELSGELARKQIDLQKLRTLTQNILASLNSGVVTVDEQGKIIYLNRAASALTGLDDESIHGRPLRDVFPHFSEALHSSEENDDLHSPSAADPPLRHNRRHECRWEHPDGETRYLGFSLAELHNSDDRAFGHIIVFQDLTTIKELEARNRRAERMAAVGELAASIAHEVRNPLASISGSVEMLESVADLDEQDRSLMNIILREVDRLDVLISEFLDYSRPPSMNFEEADLQELVDDVVELFEQRQTPVTIEVVTDAETTLRTAFDREGIRQILWNLLINAQHALEDDDVPSPRIRIALRYRPAAERSYAICVEDNGPGVPEAERERIFEPFFTTREDGSGLGLATTHRLVREHDGEIVVEESPELGGARFVVELPEHPPLTHALSEASNSEADAEDDADTTAPASPSPERPDAEDAADSLVS